MKYIDCLCIGQIICSVRIDVYTIFHLYVMYSIICLFSFPLELLYTTNVSLNSLTEAINESSYDFILSNQQYYKIKVIYLFLGVKCQKRSVFAESAQKNNLSFSCYFVEAMICAISIGFFKCIYSFIVNAEESYNISYIKA